MLRIDFEKLVTEGYEKLPEWVRLKIRNVALLVEDEPSNEDRKTEGLADDETLLGLYKGIPLSERGELYGVGMTMPDTITLYQKPIEEAASELWMSDIHNSGVQTFQDAVKSVVADTVWHEFAHHFGMDEGEVRNREQERFGDVV